MSKIEIASFIATMGRSSRVQMARPSLRAYEPLRPLALASLNAPEIVNNVVLVRDRLNGHLILIIGCERANNATTRLKNLSLRARASCEKTIILHFTGGVGYIIISLFIITYKELNHSLQFD